jgi:hypothetical protein
MDKAQKSSNCKCHHRLSLSYGTAKYLMVTIGNLKRYLIVTIVIVLN